MAASWGSQNRGIENLKEGLSRLVSAIVIRRGLLTRAFHRMLRDGMDEGQHNHRPVMSAS